MRRDSKYFQQKYEYYKKFNLCETIILCICSIAFFIWDCYLTGGLSVDTIPARLSILIPMGLYILLYYKSNDYRVMCFLNYAVTHCVMWSTVWANVSLNDLSLACEGFLIINMLFLVNGLSAPVKYAVIGQALIFADVVIANSILHYPDFYMMLSLAVPLNAGILLCQIALDKLFLAQYSGQKQMENTLIHDALTHAYNRNILPKITNDNNELNITDKDDLYLLMYDIDHFKRVNDTYRHEYGDRVLRSITDEVNRCIGEKDYLIRWGGEEFVIIAHSDEKSVRELAEKIRAKVENIKFDIGKVTISIGVAKYMGGAYLNSFKKADDNLYKAKEAGRNRVCM